MKRIFFRQITVQLPKALSIKKATAGVESQPVGAKRLLEETEALIEKGPDNLFYNLSFMTDETIQYVAIILTRLIFFYYIKPELISICPCLSIHLYYQYGQFITTPASLTNYALSFLSLAEESKKFSVVGSKCILKLTNRNKNLVSCIKAIV